ncbi:hypothetical protein [Euzebya sp.]|uniref:hypothetical protein n=1 Tax=Euzebya sp. TaxID=1971409 RepID=UPI003518720E
MTDLDPYVQPAVEHRPPPRLVDLRPLLVVAIALLLIGSVFGAQLVSARQDPTLEVPADPVPADQVPAGAPEVPDVGD